MIFRNTRQSHLNLDQQTPILASVLVYVFIVVLTTVDNAHGATFANFDSTRHDRFTVGTTPNPNFIIDESLISGLGAGAVPESRAVLISPQHYITAVHAPTSTPRFRASDGTVRTYSGTIAATLQTDLGGGMVFDSDIAIYRLAAAISQSDGVTPLPILAVDPTDLIGQELLVIGQRDRAGRNIISSTGINAFAGPTGVSHTVAYTFDTATNGGSGGLLDEAGLTGGDSGLATLFQAGDQVAVLGTNFGIVVPPGNNLASGDFYTSFSTNLQPYLNQIETIVSADGQSITTVSAVPEPSTFACLVFVCVGLRLRHRQPRQ